MTFTRILVTICLVCVTGCPKKRQEESAARSEREIIEKVPHQMVEVDGFVVGDKNGRLDYHVNNTLPHEIWVCEDIDAHHGDDIQSAETRILDDTVWVKLRFDLECNIFRDPVFARYRRLSPGESRSGVILLSLPIVNASPLYDFHERGKRVKQRMLHRVVFEVGYFDQDLHALRSNSDARGWGKPEPPGSGMTDSNVELVGHLWQGLKLERSWQVTIDDVNVPGQVANR